LRRPALPREYYITRGGAGPGDTIDVKDGVVTINGEVVPSEDTGEPFEDEMGRILRRHREDLDRGCVHDWLEIPGSRGPERTRFTVEPGRWFMMGDNRDNSNDSRIWGTVRFEEMKGPAWRLYFSWDFNGGWLPLLNPLTWINADVRWDRFGDSLYCR
jgi:signal peptidase I